MISNSASLGTYISANRVDSLEQWLQSLQFALPFLDLLAHIQFFAIDSHGRYVAVSRHFLERRELVSSQTVLGLTSLELLPVTFGAAFHHRDMQLMREGKVVIEHLELHLNKQRTLSSVLAHKHPVHGRDGTLLGMMGMFVDLPRTGPQTNGYERLAPIAKIINTHPEKPILVSEMCVIAKLSAKQLERECKRIFSLTPRQMLLQAKAKRAANLLITSCPITDIPASAGYLDHSAFSRQFKALTGFTPRQFRQATTD